MAAASQTLTQKWLRQNIHLYANQDSVYAHVDAALARFPTIRPKTDVYTYDDGRTQLLLCLHGLLPISYRGTPYHIPIAVWTTRDYPRMPPIAYVVPTSDMLVRAGQHMDVSGRSHIDYLQNWQRKSEGCSLSALLEAMQDRFSREPPVYAKPKSPLPSSSSPQPSLPDSIIPGYSERPPPPLPAAQVSPSPPQAHPVPATTTRNDDRPPIPLKPGASPVLTPPATSSSRDPRSASPNALTTMDLAARPAPPLPPHPPKTIGQVHQRESPIPPRYDASSRDVSSVSHAPPWSQDLRMRPPPAPPTTHSPTAPAQITSSLSLPPSRHTTTTYHAPQPLQPTSPPPIPPPPPVPGFPPAASPQTLGQSHYSPVPLPPPVLSPQPTGSTQQYYHASPPVVSPAGFQVSLPPPPPSQPAIPPPDLLDDDDFASANPPSVGVSPAYAPPRPPNPELLRLHSQIHGKLTSELASLSQAMSLDAERLRANQADLLAGEPAIRDEMARLEAVKDVCRNVAGRLRTVVEATEKNVNELKRKGDPEVDELVCSTSIVHNQLINLVAEDNAIEDTMYHLHRALNAGRIDLERFLKTTRVLAEEQFMKRALIEKILTGLPMGSEWRYKAGDL